MALRLALRLPLLVHLSSKHLQLLPLLLQLLLELQCLLLDRLELLPLGAIALYCKLALIRQRLLLKPAIFVSDWMGEYG